MNAQGSTPIYTSSKLLHRWGLLCQPDARRTILQEFSGGLPRDKALVERVMKLTAVEVTDLAGAVFERYSTRHPDMETTLQTYAHRALNRTETPNNLDRDRLLLLGAYFSNEYASEAAALTNPSVVPHPDQRGLEPNQLRVAISLRAIGEGHISSIAWIAAVLDNTTGFTLSPRRIVQHTGNRDTEKTEEEMVAGPWSATADTDHTPTPYTLTFPENTDLSQRLLYPSAGFEIRGIEDARFTVVSTEEGPEYRATYTAYDGKTVRPRILSSKNLQTFQSKPLTGPGATGKGIALFGQKVNGKHVALSRHDGWTSSIIYSEDGYCWSEPTPLVIPEQAWELSLVGNAGSPHLTDAGWLVVTHGVGPVRTYALGAMLLDAEDPSRVLRVLPEPLLSPEDKESEGYVPNVVYSCGSIINDDTLWVAYGVSDRGSAMASVKVNDLISAMI